MKTKIDIVHLYIGPEEIYNKRKDEKNGNVIIICKPIYKRNFYVMKEQERHYEEKIGIVPVEVMSRVSPLPNSTEL